MFWSLFLNYLLLGYLLCLGYCWQFQIIPPSVAIKKDCLLHSEPHYLRVNGSKAYDEGRTRNTVRINRYEEESVAAFGQCIILLRSLGYYYPVY